jgi:hypothetical protein
MSKVGVKLSIDVSKIDKALLYKGAKGVYLSATVFVDIDQADQYGNHGMITQDETKENREAGKNGAILGNCKVFWKDQQQQPIAKQHSNHGRQTPQPAPAYDDFDDSGDLPF